MEYNIEKAPVDFIILHGNCLNLGDLLYCVGLRAPRKKANSVYLFVRLFVCLSVCLFVYI